MYQEKESDRIGILYQIDLHFSDHKSIIRVIIICKQPLYILLIDY